MYHRAGKNMPIGTSMAGCPGPPGPGRRKIAGLVRAGKLIMEDMFRYAVFAWLAVAGPVAAAPVRAASDSLAGCPKPGKRR